MSIIDKKSKTMSRSSSIVYNEKDYINLKESYIRLKDNILFYNVDGKNNVIQVTSSVQGEAKTTTISNLAVSLAQDGKKVVCVDLDIRKPRLHRAFNIENVDGLSEYMLNTIDMDGLIKHTEYGVDIINRGSEFSNSAVILLSEKLKNLIKTLKTQYDYVLIDTPPVLIVSDFIHISRLADGLLFVVAYGRTKKAQVKEAISQLKKNNIRFIGCVFTFYDPKRNEKNAYTNYGYYNYGDKK